MIRFRVDTARHFKGGKPKKALIVPWSGQGSPLPLVQKRAKTVRSLRDQDGVELTLQQLRDLATDQLVFGSPQEGSELLERSHTAAADVGKTWPPGPTELRDGQQWDCSAGRLTRHAKERIRGGSVGKQEVANCLLQGERRPARGRAVKFTLGDLTVVRGESNVITLYRNVERRMECAPAHAVQLRPLFEEIKQQVRVAISYDEQDHTLVFRGDEGRPLDLATERLRKALHHLRQGLPPDGDRPWCFGPSVVAAEGPQTFRVKSKEDVCRHIIGAGGRVIRRLKRKLGMKFIHVVWRHGFIFVTTDRASAEALEQLREKIEDVVRHHTEPELGTEEYEERTVSVPSNTDVCGHVIGRGGVRLAEMKRQLEIDPFRYIKVEWDSATDEIHLRSNSPMLPETRSGLSDLVQDIVRQHDDPADLESELESDPEVADLSQSRRARCGSGSSDGSGSSGGSGSSDGSGSRCSSDEE